MRMVIDEFEKVVCAIVFVVMTGIGFANVVVRYLTSYSFASTQEILLNGFLILTVFGAAIAARRGEHLAVTLLADLLPAPFRKALIALSCALVLCLLILSAWYCYELTVNQYRTGVTSPGLGLPAWFYSAALPVGFLLVAVRILQHTVHELSGGTAGSDERD